VLLLKNNSLVKSQKFKNYCYIGDPINAVKIFNDFNADELVFMDITATNEKRTIPLELVKKIGEEANMPFAVGGGINSINVIKDILHAGAEKVVINSYATVNPQFVKEASEVYGSSTITICIDVKKNYFGKYKCYVASNKQYTKYLPIDFAKLMEEKGAGEIIIQSVDNDGTMTGYNVELIKSIAENVTIPVVALGGAGCINDLQNIYRNTYVTGLAAGSMFVFKGKNKGVLINYPEKNEINLFNKSI